MRQERTFQASLFDLFAGHEIGRELKAMSQWRDEDRELIGLVAEDLRRHGVKETGRQGLSAESVLRCGLLKQHRQLSYEELAFHLEDSASFRAFARLPLSWTPKKSVLHMTISAIRAETWEAINRILLASARQEKVETGKVVRLDSAVTAALLHEPSDSSLLWDAVCVMVRHIGFYGEAPRQTAADGGFASRPEGGRRSREGGGRSRGPSAFAPLSARWMVE
jgi:IS5 family transposase